MATEANTVTSPAATVAGPQQSSGKVLPQSGNGGQSARSAAAAIAASKLSSSSATGSKPAVDTTDPQALVSQLNKYVNDSGRADQFRLDPSSNGQLIQQVNPASGAVIAEYPVSEFPALARSVGAQSLLVDSRA